MAADPDCIFCKIVAGEIPSHKIDEDDRTIAFMDINPWTRGHALVIPKEHSRNLYDIAGEDLAAVAAAAQRRAPPGRDPPGGRGHHPPPADATGREAAVLPLHPAPLP